MCKYVKQGICLLLIFLTVAFIFYNSAQPVEESKEKSASVAETITPKPKDEYEKPADWRAFVAHVRKAAHAIEFFVLGAELSVLLLILLPNRRWVQAIWNTISSALAVAVTDESIQILSGRGPKVQDVLLDFCGAAAAVAVVLLFCGVVHLCKRNKCRKEESGEQ